MTPSSLRIALVTAALPVIFASAACSKPEDKTAPPSTPAATATPQATTTSESTGSGGSGGNGAAEAKTIFASRCSTCHGTEGKGNGPAAITLNPKPRNYTDAAWQKSVTDDHIREIIVKGGQAVGKSPLMPPNPDLENKPDVVTALVAIVRSFGSK